MNLFPTLFFVHPKPVPCSCSAPQACSLLLRVHPKPVPCSCGCRIRCRGTIQFRPGPPAALTWCVGCQCPLAPKLPQVEAAGGAARDEEPAGGVGAEGRGGDGGGVRSS